LHSESIRDSKYEVYQSDKGIVGRKRKTGKRLAEQLGKNPATVSRWCSTTMQSSVKTFVKITEPLNKYLFNSSNKYYGDE
jgi:hypothetical protein